jgi:hypothetical protein
VPFETGLLLEYMSQGATIIFCTGVTLTQILMTVLNIVVQRDPVISTVKMKARKNNVKHTEYMMFIPILTIITGIIAITLAYFYSAAALWSWAMVIVGPPIYRCIGTLLSRYS